MVRKIKLICGPTKSGKTSRLINEAVRLNIGQRNVAVYRATWKSGLDGTDTEIKTWSDIRLPAKWCNVINLPDISKNHDIVVIDEIHNIGDMSFVDTLRNCIKYSEVQFILGARDVDYNAKPYPLVSQVMSLAEVDVVKLYSICNMCGEATAIYSQWMKGSVASYAYRFDEGAKLMALCSNCFSIPFDE